MSCAATTALGARSATSVAGTAAASILVPPRSRNPVWTSVAPTVARNNGGEVRIPSSREHGGSRRRGGAGAVLGPVARADLLRRARRLAGSRRGDRRDRDLPAGVQRERQRPVRDQPPHRGAGGRGPGGRRRVPRL